MKSTKEKKPKDRIYTCKLCFAIFSDYESFDLHMKLSHEDF
ncbi:putative DNA-binding protein [Sulfolobus polyhedral virus 1]|uniref:Putative DNA-binding protein n=1 Tax=Sulfolobus polyhedral virus 1 TaxID=1982658 RepID=A0A1W6I140_SPV1|nr:putative DNA-binding protein [Sulfolobus polyhedral virus 1]ARM37789.1 putative DNA-binding protein [Sulfolobus polyhedral virus 1]